MTQEQEISYLRIALSFAGISVNEYALDLILEAKEMLAQKGGNATISDMVDIEFKVKNKYAKLRMDKKEDQ